jgi:hypothetical protein
MRTSAPTQPAGRGADNHGMYRNRVDSNDNVEPRSRVMMFPGSVWMRRAMQGTLAVAVLAAMGCPTKEQNRCTSDSDCKDVAYPFCDVNGEFSASGGTKNVCTIVPPDCPVERCGCSPGATSCAGDTLTTCDPGGTSQSMTACVLGCATDGTHCLSFAPTNGLGPALVAAASEPSVQLPSGSHIDTDTGQITDGGSLPIQVSSLVVTQGTTSIRVFIAKSMTIGDVSVSGSSALALVASDAITVSGGLLVRGAGTSAGPGSQDSGACVGAGGDYGGGGGGNATAGGDGATTTANSIPAAGGAVQAGFEPLVGGCRGGAQTSNGSTVANGGGGGGAVELVAGSSITISGMIDVGAGGGLSAAGGGSGGNIVLEAPHVMFSGGLFANGGGGGACSSPGADSTANTTAAAGGGPCGITSTRQVGGSGGTGTAASTAGSVRAGGAAGGGGAVGRVHVMNLDGTFDGSGGTVSASISAAQLQPM